MKEIYSLIYQLIVVIAMFVSAYHGDVASTIAFGVLAILIKDSERS